MYKQFFIKLWKRTLIQNEDEMKRRWRLRETEKAINKAMIIIHSCLRFIISTTQSNRKTSNVYASFTHDWCCHLCWLHITYNVIYTHYNRRWIVIRSKVSLFLVFSQRFEDFYRELLERNHEYTSLFIKINQDINYWSQEWIHLKEKTIVMMNWHIEIKSKTKVKDWVKDQIWVSSETLWLCQDIV